MHTANLLRVAAHIFYLAAAKELVAAGVDAASHSVRDQSVDREMIDSMKKHHTWQPQPLSSAQGSMFVYAENFHL